MPWIMEMPLYNSVGGLYIGDMIVVLFSFLIVLYIVKRFAWQPIMNMMQKREDYVLAEIEGAEKSRKEAEKTFQEAEKRLQSIKKEADMILQDAQEMARKQEEKIISQAKKEANRIKEQATKDIEQEKEKAIQAVQDQVTEISFLIASKVVEKEIDEKEQQSLVHNYVQQLGESHE